MNPDCAARKLSARRTKPTPRQLARTKNFSRTNPATYPFSRATISPQHAHRTPMWYNKKHRATMFPIVPLRTIAQCATFNPRRTPLIRATRHCVSTPPVCAIPTHPLQVCALSVRVHFARTRSQSEPFSSAPADIVPLFVRAPSATPSGRSTVGRRLPRPPYRASSRTSSARRWLSGLSKRFSGVLLFRRAADFSRF